MSLYENCNLRPLQEADLETILEWRNREGIRLNMYNSHKISMLEHRAWFDRLDPSTNNYQLFECNGNRSGLSYFTAIDHSHQRAEWGFYLGREDLPRGTGTIMGVLSLEHGYNELKLRKIYGEVLDFNRSSRKFFERLGFKRDGILREHLCRYGKTIDVCLYSQLEDEWQRENRTLVNDMIQALAQEVARG